MSVKKTEPHTNLGRKRITLKDVAQQAGVGYQTASRALNRNPLVSSSTIAQVIAAAQDLGYHSSSVSRRVSVPTLGLAVPNLDAYAAVQVARSAKAEASRRGYQVLLLTSQDLQERLSQDDLRASGMAGILLVGAVGESHYESMTAAGFPAVASHAIARIDNAGGIRQVVQLLLGLGHQRIAFIGNVPCSRDGSERRHTFEAQLTEIGLFDPSLVADGDWSIDSGYRAGHQILQNHPDVTALVCANDAMAIGSQRAAMERGYRIPQDLSITGFDNIPFAQYLCPALTTVGYPVGEMGIVAVGALIDAIEGWKAPEPRQIETQVVLRETHGPYKNGETQSTRPPEGR